MTDRQDTPGAPACVDGAGEASAALDVQAALDALAARVAALEQQNARMADTLMRQRVAHTALAHTVGVLLALGRNTGFLSEAFLRTLFVLCSSEAEVLAPADAAMWDLAVAHLHRMSSATYTPPTKPPPVSPA